MDDCLIQAEKKRTDAEDGECLCSGSLRQQPKQKKRHFNQLQLEQKTEAQRDRVSSGVCVFLETNKQTNTHNEDGRGAFHSTSSL